MRLLDTPVGRPAYFDPQSGWLHHGPFVMWLVGALQPGKVVELGTHKGFSYFAICQAVQEHGLSTTCIAVDTWQGDEHAGFYGEEVYDAVAALNAPYAGFSKLLRKTFNAALDDVADGSVDLLHVDGRHFYEDVKEDFESWIPKLSPHAVVLFHDTEVRERGFGVWKYWAEISADRPSLNLPHGHGLGVLFWGQTRTQRGDRILELLQGQDAASLLTLLFESAGDGYVRQRQGAAAHANEVGELRNVISTLNEAISELRTQNSWVHGQLSKAQSDQSRANHQIALLKEALRQARVRPGRLVRDRIQYRLLSGLARTVPGLPERTARRFRKSAEKRNPRRDDFAATVGLEASKLSYPHLVESWERRRLQDDARLRKLAADLADGPLISVVVPVYNPDPDLFAQMVASVRNQSYWNWQLCLADDRSTDPRIRELLQEIEAQDQRIRVVYREANGHISEATNSALEVAEGRYIAFVDHDDLLDRDALLWVANAIRETPEAGLVYTDEDKVTDAGDRYDPHFKPDWNPLLFAENNYVSHLSVVRADIVRQVGGCRASFEGAQDYDLLLRCIEQLQDAQIVHVPKVLYSWRASPGSTAADPKAKPYATEAGRRAIEEHLQKAGHPGITVENGPFPFTYKPVWSPSGDPLVSIIMPTRDQIDLLRRAVDSILVKTTHRNFELIILDNGSQDPQTLSYLDDITNTDPRVRVLRDDRPFNYSALNNDAVAQAKGEFVVLMNNDIEVLSENWLTEMVALAQRPGAGCIGAKLYYPDGRIQHAGVVIGMLRVAGHAHRLFPQQHPGYAGRLKLRQNYSAVTAACLLVRRAIYDEVGGLNEHDLAIAFNDIDFCLKVQTAGYANAWTPYAELIHHESVSRGQEDTPEKQARFEREVQYMLSTWGTERTADPAYNPNLSLEAEDFSFAELVP